jgi:UDP-MurNAc hydroxylase
MAVKFTVVGHSCLFFETRAGSILVDPWLFGSAGWRSWWHYPPSELRDEYLKPDWLYLTHHHPDHFHYPSMRRIDRSTRVLIPRFGVDTMRGEIARLGFGNVTELAHGQPCELARAVRVASYQYGFDDTAFVVQDGEHTVIDFNDCKMRGAPTRQILRDFGRPTFYLKGYSFAQGYPHCYSAEDPRDLELVSRETYLDDFVRTGCELGARYAIPFASMVAFLHPENFHVNERVIVPADVEKAFKRAVVSGKLGDADLAPMSPGDSWDSEHGFCISERDWYSDRERRIAELAAEVRPTIERSLAAESSRKLEFTVFAGYFEPFTRALPPLVGRILLKRPIVFDLISAHPRYFVIHARQRRCYRAESAPVDRANLIRVSEGLLADAIEKRVVHFIHGSMRFRTTCR